MIILVGSNKGGTGKSTTCINLASFLGANNKVLLCDSDNQQSLLQWNAMRAEEDLKPFDTVVLYGNIAKEIVAASQNYDFTIIDVAGRNGEEFLSALTVCDVLISPIQATQLDLNTLIDLDKQIELFKPYNDSLDENSYILHNRATTNIFIQEQERSDLEEFINELPNLKLLNSYVSERKVFKDTISFGKGIYDLKDDDKHVKAFYEYKNIFDELNIKQILEIPNN